MEVMYHQRPRNFIERHGIVPKIRGSLQPLAECRGEETARWPKGGAGQVVRPPNKNGICAQVSGQHWRQHHANARHLLRHRAMVVGRSLERRFMIGKLYDNTSSRSTPTSTPTMQ